MEAQEKPSAPEPKYSEGQAQVYKTAANVFVKEVMAFIEGRQLTWGASDALYVNAHTARAQANDIQGHYVEIFGPREREFRRFFTENFDPQKYPHFFDSNTLESKVFARMTQEVFDSSTVYARIRLSVGWIALMASKL